MKKSMLKFTYICGVALLFSLQNAYSMEVDTPRQGQEIIIISNDNQKIMVPVEIIPLIPTIQSIQERQGSVEPIKLRLFDAQILRPAIQCITEVKRQLKTRNELLLARKNPLLTSELGNAYIPKQLIPVVKKVLGVINVNIIDIMDATQFMGASFIVNACNAIWVENQFKKNPQITLDQIKLLAKKAGINDDIIDEYTTKQWNIKHWGLRGELSVADLMALNKVPSVEFGRRARTYTLNLKSQNLTSLDGLTQIKGIGNVIMLNLSHNKLIYIPSDAFQGFTQLKVLYLNNNELAIIDPQAFKGIFQVSLISLFENQLTYVHPNAFRGLNRLTKLILLKNMFTEENIEAIRAALPDITLFLG